MTGSCVSKIKKCGSLNLSHSLRMVLTSPVALEYNGKGNSSRFSRQQLALFSTHPLSLLGVADILLWVADTFLGVADIFYGWLTCVIFWNNSLSYAQTKILPRVASTSFVIWVSKEYTIHKVTYWAVLDSCKQWPPPMSTKLSTSPGPHFLMSLATREKREREKQHVKNTLLSQLGHPKIAYVSFH